MKSQPKTQQETILHYWNQGIRNGDRIHALTKINRSTVFYNLKKLREKENVANQRHFPEKQSRARDE